MMVGMALPSFLKGKKDMQASVYIDPKINLSTNEMVGIIVQFKTNSAKSQVTINKGNLNLDEAILHVKDSHLRFQKDLWQYLDKQALPYIIMNQYQEAFNGVAMKIKGKDIHSLLQSNEIEALYLNSTTRIPVKPNDPGYQV
jgi:hypothetical protein